MTFRRTTTREVELHGQTLPPREKVVLFYHSGNRDESAFERPLAFDVTPSPNHHLGFGGGGPHYCMGASLARAQLTAIFGEMLRGIPDIESGEPELLRSASIHAIKRMPCSSPHGPDRVIAEALARGEATRVRRDAQAAGWVTSCSSVPSGCCSCRALRTSPPSRLSIAPDERPSRCPAA